MCVRARVRVVAPLQRVLLGLPARASSPPPGGVGVAQSVESAPQILHSIVLTVVELVLDCSP